MPVACSTTASRGGVGGVGGRRAAAWWLGTQRARGGRRRPRSHSRRLRRAAAPGGRPRANKWSPGALLGAAAGPLAPSLAVAASRVAASRYLSLRNSAGAAAGPLRPRSGLPSLAPFVAASRCRCWAARAAAPPRSARGRSRGARGRAYMTAEAGAASYTRAKNGDGRAPPHIDARPSLRHGSSSPSGFDGIAMLRLPSLA